MQEISISIEYVKYMRAILLVLSSDKPTTVWNMEGSSLVRCAEQILRVYLVPLNVIAKKRFCWQINTMPPILVDIKINSTKKALFV